MKGFITWRYAKNRLNRHCAAVWSVAMRMPWLPWALHRMSAAPLRALGAKTCATNHVATRGMHNRRCHRLKVASVQSTPRFNPPVLPFFLTPALVTKLYASYKHIFKGGKPIKHQVRHLFSMKTTARLLSCVRSGGTLLKTLHFSVYLIPC